MDNFILKIFYADKPAAHFYIYMHMLSEIVFRTLVKFKIVFILFWPNPP